MVDNGMPLWMKLFLGLISVVIVGSLLISFGGQNIRRWVKDIQSDTIGITRDITLYAVDGSPIQEWKDVKTTVRTEGGSADWIGSDGKRIIISGTFVIEER